MKRWLQITVVAVVAASICVMSFSETTGAPPVAEGLKATNDSWPMFRGDMQMTGVANTRLPETMQLKWEYQGAIAIESTAAIGLGRVYIGDLNGVLHAIDLETGKGVWKMNNEVIKTEIWKKAFKSF